MIEVPKRAEDRGWVICAVERLVTSDRGTEKMTPNKRGENIIDAKSKSADFNKSAGIIEFYRNKVSICSALNG
ncbi:hypothetical protein L596_006970 [Steinernema carpocapsae]|uniref:Uncharacterized protein n=1 Tax=Steinernema carpocapsae TaxID=34508 RepID=A0A4U5P7T0_STECR|nr:hypothetical protein L596_006970 [Steinernema carpocapsae]